jgi:hypothetical protein
MTRIIDNDGAQMRDGDSNTEYMYFVTNIATGCPKDNSKIVMKETKTKTHNW